MEHPAASEPRDRPRRSFLTRAESPPGDTGPGALQRPRDGAAWRTSSRLARLARGEEANARAGGWNVATWPAGRRHLLPERLAATTGSPATRDPTSWPTSWKGLRDDGPITNRAVRQAPGLDRTESLATLDRLVKESRLIRIGGRRGTKCQRTSASTRCSRASAAVRSTTGPTSPSARSGSSRSVCGSPA